MRSGPWRDRALCVLSLMFASLPAAEAQEDSKKVCASAYESGQRLMRSGALLEARKKLVLCGGPQCPAVMQPTCQQWLSEVEASTPTLVFQVTSSGGSALRDARVSIDGGAAVAVDGRAISVNPGDHEVAISAPGYRSTQKHVIISEGEKLRREVVLLDVVALAAPEDPTAASVPRPIMPGAAPRSGPGLAVPIIIASSVAVLAGASAVYFGVKARADDQKLTCAPGCSKDRVDEVRREYLWTNISIGIAAAGLATAGVLFLFDTRSAKGSTGAALAFGAGPFGFGASAIGNF